MNYIVQTSPFSLFIHILVPSLIYSSVLFPLLPCLQYPLPDLRVQSSLSSFYVNLHFFSFLSPLQTRIGDAMWDLSATPIFLFIPFVAFFLLFVLILALKICCSSLFLRNCIGRVMRRAKESAPRNTPNGVWRTPTSSTESIEALRAEAAGRVTITHSRDQPTGEPPGYYAGVLPVTETTGTYAMQVPNYTVAQNNTNTSSLRDPRMFGGLAGIAAPPPYPPPPAYSQISNFPEMPGRNPSSSTALPATTCMKISEFPPVA